MLTKFKAVLLAAAISALSGCGGGSDAEPTPTNGVVTPAQTNRAPNISGVADIATELQAFQFTPTVSDADNDVLRFSIDNKPDWLIFDTATGTLSGTPARGDAHTYANIVITVSDGKLTNKLILSITVVKATPRNQIPSISGTAPNAIEGQWFVFTPTAIDADQDPLTFSIVNAPAWLKFDATTGSLSGTPSANDVGQYANILLTVSDGLDSATLSLSIHVANAVRPNQAPSISGTPNSVMEEDEFNFSPTVIDADGDALRFDIQNKPAWANFNALTGQLTGSPARGQAGVYQNIVITVSDGVNISNLNLAITVIKAPPLNQAPSISGTPSEVTEEQPFSFTPTTSDIEGDQLSFSITNKPLWLHFDSATGTLSGTPTIGESGSYEGITISVSDGPLQSHLTFGITVNAAKVIPLQLSSGVAATQYFHPISSPETENSTLPITYRVINLPAWAIFNETQLSIAGVPTDAGEHSIKIVAKNAQHTWLMTGTIQIERNEKYLSKNLRDFYSTDYSGAPRTLRNDLNGDLAAEIQFVQSHSVAPNNNYVRNTADETQSRYMPKLVAQRDTLLLFIPQSDLDMDQVNAEFMINDTPVLNLPLQHPNLLPATDLDNGNTLAYSTKAWWAKIPWQHVKNGLHIKFTAGDKSGTLAANNIDIGPASQLVLKSLRLGMLTAPDKSAGHFTLIDPIMAATDYFQTIPTSKLVVASYADMTLNRVILGNGTIYDKNIDITSRVEGDVYGGDMRGDVAKAQVSTGINMADFGYTSHNMQQNYPHVIKQITNHHAWGHYINGRIAHGLSGGNGIGTLISSAGNEASHEWGHAYGLGHYPGQTLTADGRWAVHHADSGWGFIAHRQRLRSNVVKIKADQGYEYHRDAMSGGSSNSQFSKYTHHTGYSARVIQENLASFPIPDTSFTTGYKKWNTQTGQYDAFQDKTPRPAPSKVGVAVATILGGYDPNSYKAVIYPVFHGNYGNVFDLPAPDMTPNVNQCWVELNNAQNQPLRIKVAATRHNAATINQLHFNVDADFKPTLAVLFCRHNEVLTELTRTSFDGNIPELPAVAVVGQEHGFNQLKQREFAEIEQELTQLSAHALMLPPSLVNKVASYSSAELVAALSRDNQNKLARLTAYQTAAQTTSVLLQHAAANQLAPEILKPRLQQHLQQAALSDGDLLPIVGSEIYGSGVFFDSRAGEQTPIAVTKRTAVPQNERSLWFRDAAGRIHSSTSPWLCLSQVDNSVMLQLCSSAQQQLWQTHNGNALLVKNVATGKCLDFDYINVKLIPYGCHGGSNQQWSGITENRTLWLALLHGNDIKTMIQLWTPRPE